MFGGNLKSRVLSLYLVYCLVSLGFMGILLFECMVDFGSVEAETIIVDCHHKGDYSTIQRAIDAANTGDIVLVSEGTYYENLIINKTITLIGKDSKNTIIDGMGDGNVITIIANRVTINNFTIINKEVSSSYNGIRALNVNNLSINNNFFSCHRAIGIYLSCTENSEIKNNIFENNYCGIFLYKSESNLIKNNIVLKSKLGIKLSYSTYNLLITNRLIDNELIIEGDNSKHWDTNDIVNLKEETIDDELTVKKTKDNSKEIRFAYSNLILIILLIILGICYYKPGFILDKLIKIKNNSVKKNQVFRSDHYKFKYKSKYF